jgi:toxin HigB-1
MLHRTESVNSHHYTMCKVGLYNAGFLWYLLAMDVVFEDPDLDRLEIDPSFDGGHSGAVVKAYRKRLQLIRGAPDERDFYALKSLHFEKLQGPRSHQHSMRLNLQWRLVLELRGKGTEKVVHVVGIEDYH